MARQTTPNTFLTDVSQETSDDVVDLVMGRKPASRRLIDVFDLDGPSVPIVLYSDAPEPVSYTHLDVYKRQVIEPASRDDLVECTTVQRGTVWLGPL